MEEAKQRSKSVTEAKRLLKRRCRARAKSSSLFTSCHARNPIKVVVESVLEISSNMNIASVKSRGRRGSIP
jgi:hypothetical protein